MGRPRKYGSQAERQKAYLERQAEEKAIDEIEERYVAEQLAQTKAYAESFRAPEKSNPQALKERLERAEVYARWRYRAFVTGEVASL